MKIGILTISHQRPKIDKAYCLMIDRLMSSYPDLLPVCVVSTDEDKKVFEEHGIETYIYPNNPVGYKHNYGLQKLRGRVDHVLHLGSDDIIDNRYMKELLSHKDKDIVWGRGITFYSSSLKIARYWEQPFKNMAGPGKLMSAALLDRLNWSPWGDLDRGLDRSCYQNLEPHIKTKSVFITMENKSLLMDIKSRVNINPFSSYINNGREMSLNYIYKRLSEEEINYLKSMN